MDHAAEQPLPHRLTLRFIFAQFVERFFNLEHGVLRTARELTTEPGAMIRRYVEGDRTGYANPLTYLVLCSAMSIAVQTLTGFRARFIEDLKSGLDTSPEQMQFFNDFTELIFQNTLYLSFAVLVPLALALRFFFRRSGRNLAEVLVFALYAGSQAAIFGLVVIPVYLVTRMNPNLNSALGLAIAIAYFAFAAVGFFGKGRATVVKTAVSYLLSFAVFMVFVFAATLSYLLFVRPPSLAGKQWSLVTAAEENLVAKARILLDDGSDVDQTSRRTALHVAAEAGHAEMVDLLLEHDANVDARDHAGRVPMLLALAGGHQELAWRLAEAGTEPAAQTDYGMTLVIAALRQDDAELVRWLLERGADPNAVLEDKDEATALMIAADDDDLGLVELLLKHGADPSLTNEDGDTALDLAGSEEVKVRLRAPPPL